MNEVWDLDPIYLGFEDPAFAAKLPGMEALEGLRQGIDLTDKNFWRSACRSLQTRSTSSANW